MEEQAVNPLERYYNKQNDETKACLLALKSIILSIDSHIVHLRKFQIPFFAYKNLSISFLWVNKKKILLGFIVDKKAMPQEKMKRQKDGVSTLEINPLEDIPIELIKNKLSDLIERYEKVLIKSEK